MKKLFLILAAVLMAVSAMTENYRVDSTYHYFTIRDKQVIAKVNYFYNNDGQKTQTDSYIMRDGKWDKPHVTTFEYNSKGLLVSKTNSNKTKRGISYTQEVYTYNDTLISSMERKTKSDTTEWQTTYLYEYEYNSQNLLIRESWKKDNREHTRKQFMYDMSGNKIQYDIYEWDNGVFGPTVRNTYLYDGNNLLIQEKCYLKDKLSKQLSYEYDENHLLTKKTEYLLYDNILRPFSQFTYSYNKEGKVVRELTYSYKEEGAGGRLVLSRKKDNTYDAMGNLTSTTNMCLINETWYPLPDTDERWVYYFTEIK